MDNSYPTARPYAETHQKSGLRPDGPQVPGRACGRRRRRRPAQSAKDIAEAYHIPPQLLAKILQTLARGGLLVSHAGTNGGYALARPASEITAFEVIRTIDGPLFITSCITIHGTCDLDSHCTIKEPLRKVNDSIKDLLSGIRIADLIEPPTRASTSAPVGGGLVSIAL